MIITNPTPKHVLIRLELIWQLPYQRPVFAEVDLDPRFASITNSPAKVNSVWIKDHNCVSCNKARHIGDVVYSIEPKSKLTNFVQLCLFCSTAQACYIVKVFVSECSIVVSPECRTLAGLHSIIN